MEPRFSCSRSRRLDEITADDKEDKDAGGPVEDTPPKERNGGRDFKALDAVESENEKDGQRP